VNAETYGVTTYGVPGSAGRASSFSVDGCEVLVRPVETAGDGTETAFGIACGLARARAEIHRMKEELSTAASEIANLRAKVTPPRGARLLGKGCVRFRNGHPIILNSRKEGWSAFGFEVESWDDLFRRWDVAVTCHGSDEVGEWWEVENCRPTAGGAK
jgi:hypothetical protein